MALLPRAIFVSPGRRILVAMMSLVVTALLGAGQARAFDDDIFGDTAGKTNVVKEADTWYSGWHGSVLASVGLAPSSHDVSGFNRTDTGIVEQLYLLKLSHEWWLSDDVFLLTGGQADLRYYNQQPRAESVPEDQYEDHDLWLRAQDSYIQWNLSPSFWLRHGYYVVSYGMSDAFDVIDKLTPRDTSRWGQELSSSSREPLWLGQAIWDLGASKIGMTMTHAFQGNRIGLPGSDYDSAIEFRSSGNRVNDPQEPQDFKPEWVIDGRGSFPSGDWAFLVGEIYNKSATLKFDSFLDGTDTALFTPQYTRTQIVGAGLDYATGSLVWKGELVWLKDYEEMTFPGAAPQTDNLSYSQALLGMDFMAPANTIISIETRFSRVESRSVAEEVSIQIIKNVLNDRLRSQLRLASMPDDAGRFYQLALTYDLTDTWSVNAKYTNYIKTDNNNYFTRFENSDRLIFGINLQF